MLDEPWFESQQGKDIFLSFETSPPLQGPNKSSLQWSAAVISTQGEEAGT